MDNKDASQIKVAIVGAGVAGLAAGVYAKRAGFDVTIYEKHIVAGGLSSSWSRKGYLFEGGMHWLTGSSEKLALNKVWREVGALKDNNPIFLKDPFYTLICNSTSLDASASGDSSTGKNVSANSATSAKRDLHLYRDINKLEKHFIEYAPEDTRAIKQMFRDMKLFRGIHMIINDIPFLKTRKRYAPSLKELIKMTPASLRYIQLNNKKYTDYVARFKNSHIRHLLLSVIGTRYNALSFIYTLVSFVSGDCGYPEGGSRVMTQNMADTFTSLGGKIEYRTEVTGIATETSESGKNKITGVCVDGKLIEADAVIVAQDTLTAINSLLKDKLHERWTDKMRRIVKTEQNMFICLGVKADLKNYPRAFVIPLDAPFKAGPLEFGELRVNNYSLYKDHSPAGCTSLTCLLLGDSYSWWKAAKKDGSYQQKKSELAAAFIETLSRYVPEIKDNVEVTDVATPLTYERYCASAEGSWMSVWQPGDSMFSFPNKSKSVDGLYFASQRTAMPGGLPVAVTSGRKAAQFLCRDNGVMF